mmetsp:Transcript_12350/g.22369  ORF Transcript_12350/g.22369 Transcript_12350/m.22369 type:complete len:1742 (-) Transcript_12350:2680-7905(-)
MGLWLILVFFAILPSCGGSKLRRTLFLQRVQDYHFIILAQIRSRRKFTGTRPIEYIDRHRVTREMKDRADAIRRKKEFTDDVHPEERVELPQDEDDEKGEEREEVEVFEPVPNIVGVMPTITQLNDWLEDCFTHPAYCVRNLGEMTRDVHSVIDRPQDHRYLFQLDSEHCSSPDQLETAINLAVDEFLQSVVLLSERQPQVMQPLLRILVYLSTVVPYNFGKRCVQQLRDLMGGGEGHALEVIHVINEYMVPILDRTDDSRLRNQVIENLVELASSPTLPDGLDISPLDNAVSYIASCILRTRIPAPPSDELLHMASVASANSRIAQELGGMGVSVAICRDLIEAQSNSQRYLYVLMLIKNLARYDVITEKANEETVDEDEFDVDDTSKTVHRGCRAFAKENIHRSIRQNFEALTDEKGRTGTQAGDVLLRESIFCLAALSHVKSVYTDLMDSRFGTYFPNLLTLNSMQRAGPIVLCAVYTALAQILTVPKAWYPLRYEDSVLERNVVFAEITRRLQRVVPLLQYLGEKGAKFESICALVPEAERQLHFRGQRAKLSTLTSPTMHSFLVSVINLITVYNRAAAEPNNELAQRITQELNKAKREVYLFACLNTPSDNVRLAVVRCLQEIQLSEFDHQEINYLVELLANVINISSGKTEEVLGGSFKLLTRLCVSSHASGASFRASFAEKSATAALSILERNEQRDTRGQVVESLQKRILSKACVQFIQACSQFKSLGNFLRSHAVLDKLISILTIEDTNSKHVVLGPRTENQVSIVNYRPNLIEQTYCGRQVEYLLRTLVGFRSLSPSGPVAPRVVRRIADVLMGIPDPSLKMLRRFWKVDEDEPTQETSTNRNPPPAWVVEQLEDASNPEYDFRALTNKLAQRDRFMSLFWNNLMGPEVGCSDIWIDEGFLDQDQEVAKLQQHQLFVHFSGLERLLLYLAGAVEKNLTTGSTKESVVLSSLSISQLVSGFHVVDAKGIMEKVLLRADAVGEKSEEGQSNTRFTGKKVLLRYFLQETVASEDTGEGEYPDADTVLFGPNAASFQRDSAVTGVLVAGLRAIFALIRFGNSDTIDSAKKILRAPSKLRILACICAGSPSRPLWCQSLIGAKFMAICYDVCLMPGIRRQESLDTIGNYAIVCTVAKRILSTLMFFCESGTLTEANLVTTLHTTRTLALIARQLEYIQVDPKHRDLALGALWNTLMPFNSIVKSCIALMIACSAPMPAGGGSISLLRGYIQEHVTQFLVSTFSVSADTRYDVLEELVRAQVHHTTPLRATYTQELLDRVAYAAFEKKLHAFMRSSKHFSLGVSFEPIQETVTVAEEPSIFAMCTGSRATTRKKRGNVSSNKTWVIEPPPPSSSSVAIPAPGAVGERQIWEVDRIGEERILTSTFAEVYENGTAPSRGLLVLTSEAYYLYSVVGESEEQVEKSELLYRKPYRAVERVVQSMYGGCIHLQHRNSDIPGSRNPERTTFVMYTLNASAQVYSFFMQMCREWSRVEASLGVDSMHLHVPPVETDAPLRDALCHVLDRMQGGEEEDKEMFETSTCFSSALIDLSASSTAERLENVLFAHVVHIKSDGTRHKRVILATNRRFCLLDANWRFWSFASDFESERRRFLVSLKSGADVEESTLARMIASMNAQIEAKVEREKQQREKILTLGKEVEPLLDLNELLLSTDSTPVLTLGFGKLTKNASMFSTKAVRKQSLEGPGSGKKGGESKSYYELEFHDHKSREEWFERLLPILH